MLGKLLKYEFKSTARVFLPLYITILVVAIINSFFINSELFQIQGLLMTVFVALMIAMFVITVIVIVQRFNKNLLGDEGYLMFTLPVNSTTILFSKYLIALLWTLLSAIVAVVAFFLITSVPIFSEMGFDLNYWINTIQEYFYLIIGKDFIYYAISLTLLTFVSYSIFIFTVYLSLSMGQLPLFNKHRNLYSFISFIGINVLFSFIQNLFTSLYFSNNIDQTIISVQNNAIDGFNSFIQDGLFAVLGFNLILLLVLFLGTKFLLDNKLNLE